MSEPTLKTRPKFDDFTEEHEEEDDVFMVEEYVNANDVWFEGFEKKVKNFDAQKWFDENVYEDWTWEGMLEKFIEKEILGDNKR